MFIRFTARAFRKLLSIYVFSCFNFGFEGRIWDLIVSVPDHCLSLLFSNDFVPVFFRDPNNPVVSSILVENDITETTFQSQKRQILDKLIPQIVKDIEK